MTPQTSMAHYRASPRKSAKTAWARSGALPIANWAVTLRSRFRSPLLLIPIAWRV